MAKSKSGTTSTEKNQHGESNGAGNFQADAARTNGRSHGTDRTINGEYADLVEQAREWIEENQTAAMLSGFGFGVFIGVLLRR